MLTTCAVEVDDCEGAGSGVDAGMGASLLQIPSSPLGAVSFCLSYTCKQFANPN